MTKSSGLQRLCFRLNFLLPIENRRLCNTKRHFLMLGHIDGLVQGRRNSIANALELRLSCTNPSTRHMAESGRYENWYTASDGLISINDNIGSNTTNKFPLNISSAYWIELVTLELLFVTLSTGIFWIQGCSRICNRLSLRCLVPWSNLIKTSSRTAWTRLKKSVDSNHIETSPRDPCLSFRGSCEAQPVTQITLRSFLVSDEVGYA